ncbi:kirola-like [Bidens hawaiensis]|uniref:kirola-like n=1 Tax=Bidens hawaiensis TaxID=980011 RepID=UPI00404A0856
MALCEKLIGYVEISKSGDVLISLGITLDLFRHNPHEIVAITPDKGKKKIAKQIIELVNEENHMTVFKVIGGDLVDDLYKSFTLILHVEPKGNGQVATWTFEFEKPDTSVPYPTSLMDYLCNIVKDLDAHNNTK